ncbi:MAG: hypothetical protein V9G12_23210 [Microthrixaceae bacterium]
MRARSASGMSRSDAGLKWSGCSWENQRWVVAETTSPPNALSL